MFFCGQCGLQLSPGITVCPRCGAPVDLEPDAIREDVYRNEPTFSSNPSHISGYPYTGSATPHYQQPLILRSDENNYSEGQADFPTSAFGSPTPPMHTPMPPSNPGAPTAYPDYIPMIASNSAGQNTPHWDYSGSQPDRGFPLPQAAPARRPARSGRGRNIALLFVLFCLLALLAGMIYYFLTYVVHRSPTSQTPLTATQQAQAVITQYYDDINNQNYQAAYNLWANRPLPYNQFVQGYAHTKHDAITFDNTSPLANGNVRVLITITATEQRATGITTSIYKGTYVVANVNGNWLISRGSFRKAN